ncbi:sperm-associated antigen 7 homolog, partial [Hyalella azteca]|uniref:Sperm-associated antigen 7 homolog n=1 Tax=Hyalella azteca TaxID=294128 RepID=A0A8B7PEG7_HYAAZ
MDLLDSIMSKMAKPPSIDDKQKKLMREQQKVLDEARSKEREELSKFRRQMEQRVHSFILDDRLEKLRLEPMEQVARSVVRDVADVAGLTTYTFGVEGEDRYVMLFKKDYPLDERELHAYRNGLEWDPAQAQRLTAQLAEAQR